VVVPLELPGALHRQQVAGIGHNTKLAVAALFVAADLTDRLGREVEAALALAHLAAGCKQGVGEVANLLLRLAQKVQSKPLGRARANAR